MPLLLDLPEEILFVILESAILPLDWLLLPEPQSLFTCRTIYRIGLPILYRSIPLTSNEQASKVERTILSQPELVCHIRHLYLSPLQSWLGVFRAIGHAKGSLQTLDFVFHWNVWGQIPDEEAPLSLVPVRRLVVRRGFMHRPHPMLARAIESWASLEVVIIEHRHLLLPISRDQPSPLALALSRSPSLRVLRTSLPSEWDPSLLIASENPSLVRIVLTKAQKTLDGFSSTDVEVSVAELLARCADHPWLVEAQRHPRLMTLIGAKQETDDV